MAGKPAGPWPPIRRDRPALRAPARQKEKTANREQERQQHLRGIRPADNMRQPFQRKYPERVARRLRLMVSDVELLHSALKLRRVPGVGVTCGDVREGEGQPQ